MKPLSLNTLTEYKFLTTLTLVFLSVQFIFFEGTTVSIPKVTLMIIISLVFVSKSFILNKPLVIGICYLFVTIFMCFFNGGITYYSTFWYSALFIFTFSAYYDWIWNKHCFSIDYFIYLIEVIIYSYTICLILQQLCVLVGFRYFPFFNLMGFWYYSPTHLNTLAIEPSHAARILTVYFYAFLKCKELVNNSPISLKELFTANKWLVLSFLYTMLFIGSGTAIVGLSILSLYFMKREYAVPFGIMGIIAYFAVPYIDYEPLTRARATLNATMTGDQAEVVKADASAWSRVNILLDIFQNTDLLDSDTWIGHGMDTTRGKARNLAIYEYGLISYLIKLSLFFSCCFTRFFSLEIIIFILLFGMNIGNIAYGWATLMVFSTIKYFTTYKDDNIIYREDFFNE